MASRTAQLAAQLSMRSPFLMRQLDVRAGHRSSLLMSVLRARSLSAVSQNDIRRVPPRQGAASNLTFERLEGESLPNYALRLSRTDAPVEVWEAFEEAALPIAGSWRGQEMAQVLHACTVAKRRPQRLLEKLAKDVPDKLPQFGADGLCVCLHSFAQLRRRDSSLFSTITRWMLQPQRRDDIGTEHVASLVYSHVRTLLSDKGLISAAQTHLSSGDVDRLNSADIATMLQAFATWNVSAPTAAQRCADLMAARESSTSLPMLCDTLGALVKLDVPCKNLQRTIAKRVEANSEELDDLSIGDLSKLILGLGGSKNSVRARVLVVSQLKARAEELDGPQAYAQALEALAQVSNKTPNARDAADEVARQMSLKVVDFSVKNIASVATACQKLLVDNPGALEALARQGLRKGWRFRPRYAHAVLDACDAVRFDHPILDELRASTERYEQEASDRREAREKEVEEDPSEPSSKLSQGRSSRGTPKTSSEHEREEQEDERELERLLESDEIFDDFVRPGRSASRGYLAGDAAGGTGSGEGESSSSSASSSTFADAASSSLYGRGRGRSFRNGNSSNGNFDVDPHASSFAAAPLPGSPGYRRQRPPAAGAAGGGGGGGGGTDRATAAAAAAAATNRTSSAGAPQAGALHSEQQSFARGGRGGGGGGDGFGGRARKQMLEHGDVLDRSERGFDRDFGGPRGEPFKDDKLVQFMLRDVQKKILSPAGMVSETMPTPRPSGRKSRGRR